MTETAKERIYREALEKVSRSLPVNSELDLVIAEALIKAKYLPATTDKLSVEKIQKQLNTIKAALIVIRADIEEHNQIYDLSTDTALLLEGIDGIAFEALAAIGGDDEL